MDTAPGPHDSLFRRVFSDPANAADELRHVLPAEVAVAIDWASLQIRSGSFVDARLRTSQADLLCSVELAGRETLLYVLLEHKSWPDPSLPLQLLGYVVRIWRAFWRHNPRGQEAAADPAGRRTPQQGGLARSGGPHTPARHSP